MYYILVEPLTKLYHEEKVFKVGIIWTQLCPFSTRRELNKEVGLILPGNVVVGYRDPHGNYTL